ncbi:MAG: sialidase family protein [Planctomycetota bacterium]
MHALPTLPSAALLVGGAFSAFQHAARDPVAVSDATIAAPRGVAVAADGDLAAVLFEDDATQRVYVAVADARALAFGPPVRIDGDVGAHDKAVGPTVFEASGALAVRGDTVYASWLDERNAAGGGFGGAEAVDVYFARSTDAGATWTEQPVPKGYAVGGSSPVLSYAMAVSDDGEHVYVAQIVDPSFFGGVTTELWLAASHDGGLSFDDPIRVDGGSTEQRFVALALDGDVLHVAHIAATYPPGTWSYDVFHQAAPFGAGFPATPTQVDLYGEKENLAIAEVGLAARAGVVAVSWTQNDDGGAAIGTDPFVAVSSDGGANFGAPTSASSAAPYANTTYETAVAVAADGAVVVAWADDRNGPLATQTTLFAARSADGGASWSPEVDFGAPTSRGTRLAARGDDLVLSWQGSAVRSAFSRDGGLTWSQPDIDVSGPDPNDFPFRAKPSALAELYDNALFAYVGREEGDPQKQRVFVGGYRLPEVAPQGFLAGGTAHVELASFSGAAPVAWVVFSAAPGDLILPFGDGRNLGLAFDSLLTASLASPAVLLTGLDAAGTGATASFAVPFAPGTQLFAAAVSLALAPAVELDEVTDAVAIEVQ